MGMYWTTEYLTYQVQVNPNIPIGQSYQYQIGPIVAPVGQPTDTKYSFSIPSSIDFSVFEPKLVSVCPDCRGTKEYIGLLKKEPCAACKGTGVL